MDRKSKLDHQPAAGNQPSGRDFVRTLDLAASNWLPKTPTTTPSLNPERSGQQKQLFKHLKDWVRVACNDAIKQPKTRLQRRETEARHDHRIADRGDQRVASCTQLPGRPKDVAGLELAEYGDT